jgi:hypothetical protein
VVDSFRAHHSRVSPFAIAGEAQVVVSTLAELGLRRLLTNDSKQAAAARALGLRRGVPSPVIRSVAWWSQPGTAAAPLGSGPPIVLGYM